MEFCTDCHNELTQTNWFPSLREQRRRLCKDCSRTRNRHWRLSHPHETHQQSRRHYAKHREKMLLAKKLWDAKNRPKISLRDKKKHLERRRDVIQAYGGKCSCCDDMHQEFLTIDHINGDGKTHRQQLKSRAQAHLYRYLQKENYPKDGFRLLCYNCNMARAHYGYCPHKPEQFFFMP